MGVGAAAVLTGVWLVLVPVREARAYDAASTCVAGTGRERAGDCLSGAPAVLERVRTEGNRNPTSYLVVVRADGSRGHVRPAGSVSARHTQPGTALLLVSWAVGSGTAGCPRTPVAVAPGSSVCPSAV